jgi:hypothetical protein
MLNTHVYEPDHDSDATILAEDSAGDSDEEYSRQAARKSSVRISEILKFLSLIILKQGVSRQNGGNTATTRRQLLNMVSDSTPC